MNTLTGKAKQIRREVFEMIVNAGKGHIGGSFSCVEILTALYYGGVLKVDATKKLDRDIFILGKGHACAVLYTILADLGYFPKEELNTFAKEGKRLEAHITTQVPGVEVSTGSLGLGIGIGTGIALADKMDGRKRKVIVLMGDAECHEGSVWESAMLAAHHKLSQLLVIVDRNNLSVLDFISNYNDLEPFAAKWRAFGWNVFSANGHSTDEILDALNAETFTRPKAIIAQTIKGKGVSFMEGIPIWHHKFPSQEEIALARRELA